MDLSKQVSESFVKHFGDTTLIDRPRTGTREFDRGTYRL